MNCAELRPLFHAFLDGELDAAEKAGLKRHLSRCPGCRPELALLMATVDLAARVEVMEPDPLFNRKVMRHIFPPSRIFVRVAAIAALSAGACLILLGYAGSRLIASADTWLYPLVQKALPFIKGAATAGQHFGRAVALFFPQLNPSVVCPALFAVLAMTLLALKLATYRTRFGQSRYRQPANGF